MKRAERNQAIEILKQVQQRMRDICTVGLSGGEIEKIEDNLIDEECKKVNFSIPKIYSLDNETLFKYIH